jgi:GcrA cell cycle regulator
MSWTDERVELLKKLWMEGHSASQIAKELGSVTRNAVIGKVHRLGLSSRIAGAGEVAEATEPAVPSVAEAATPEQAAPAEAVIKAEAEVEVAAPPAKDEAPDQPPQPEAAPRPDVTEREEAPDTVVQMPARRPVVVSAGQPLPPQPSHNEISPEAMATVREVEKTARKLSLMELTERTCKWPIGDPATEAFWFCGLPVQTGKPYCDAHVAVAFQPMQSRRDRRR